jgi:PIN domain nuclease of toxin-antitoxin system
MATSKLPDRVPPSFREQIESPDNEVLFSAASIWEIAIKQQIGRLSLNVTPEELADAARSCGMTSRSSTLSGRKSSIGTARRHDCPAGVGCRFNFDCASNVCLATHVCQ